MAKKREYITLPWVNIIRNGRRKLSNKELVAKLFKYGLEEENKVERAFYKATRDTQKVFDKETREMKKVLSLYELEVEWNTIEALFKGNSVMVKAKPLRR